MKCVIFLHFISYTYNFLWVDLGHPAPVKVLSLLLQSSDRLYQCWDQMLQNGVHPVAPSSRQPPPERPQSDAQVLDRVDSKKRPSQGAMGAFVPKLPPKKKVSFFVIGGIHL